MYIYKHNIPILLWDLTKKIHLSTSTASSRIEKLPWNIEKVALSETDVMVVYTLIPGSGYFRHKSLKIIVTECSTREYATKKD